MTSRSLALVGAMALLGCSSYRLAEPSAPSADLLSPPPSGAAKICVVRPQARSLSATAVVHDNGNLVGATRGKSYFCYLAEPGEHLISTRAERDAADAVAQVSAGSSYYLRQNVDSGFQHLLISQEWIDARAARDEARELHYSALSAAPQKEVLPQVGMIAPASRADSDRSLVGNTQSAPNG